MDMPITSPYFETPKKCFSFEIFTVNGLPYVRTVSPHFGVGRCPLPRCVSNSTSSNVGRLLADEPSTEKHPVTNNAALFLKFGRWTVQGTNLTILRPPPAVRGALAAFKIEIKAYDVQPCREQRV